MAHWCAWLAAGQTVEFAHAEATGRARVVWPGPGGYRLDSQNSFALSVEEARPTDGSDRGGAVGNYRLRYGLKF